MCMPRPAPRGQKYLDQCTMLHEAKAVNTTQFPLWLDFIWVFGRKCHKLCQHLPHPEQSATPNRNLNIIP